MNTEDEAEEAAGLGRHVVSDDEWNTPDDRGEDDEEVAAVKRIV